MIEQMRKVWPRPSNRYRIQDLPALGETVIICSMGSFNLLDSKSLEAAIQNGVPCLEGQSVESVMNAMEQFRVFKTNLAFFNFSTEGLCGVSGAGWAETIAVKNILRVGSILNQLCKFKNFNSFATGFNNPEQFRATMFEVNCCDAFNNEFKVVRLEFEPDHSVKGSIKKPEFKAIFDDGLEIFVECKTLGSLNGLRNSRVMKIKDAIFETILPLVPNNRRVEISFKVLPQHWNRNYVEQLSGAVGQLIKDDFQKQHIELVIDQSHTTWIKLCDRSEPQFLNNIVNVGEVPKEKSPQLILGELANIKKDIKDLIKDARTQLSEESYSVIFIYSLHEGFATQAISEFFEDNKPKKLLGIFSWTSSLRFHRNTFSEMNLNDHLRNKSI